MLDISKLNKFLEEYGASEEISTIIKTFIDYIEGKQRTKGAAVIPYERREATKRHKYLLENQAKHKEDNLEPSEDFERIQNL